MHIKIFSQTSCKLYTHNLTLNHIKCVMYYSNKFLEEQKNTSFSICSCRIFRENSKKMNEKTIRQTTSFLTAFCTCLLLHPHAEFCILTYKKPIQKLLCKIKQKCMKISSPVHLELNNTNANS